MKKQLLLFVMMVLPFMASAHDIEVQALPFITTTLIMVRNWRLLSVVIGMILIRTNIKAMSLYLKK